MVGLTERDACSGNCLERKYSAVGGTQLLVCGMWMGCLENVILEIIEIYILNTSKSEVE